MTRSGRCLCGAIQYQLEGELGPLVNCHCQYCRRTHGAAFITTTWVSKTDLHFTSGADAVREYRTEGVGVRAFCERCGTRLYNGPETQPGFVALLIASLDEEPEGGPLLHVNVESKAGWYEILDGLPQFDKLPAAAQRILDE